ncbi:molybdenum cofactor guanylyltransferase MobA [Paenalcaligenes sp. Me131]|uniref:molybdenum cofactor guanylyltransferase MobA n=1 Tax=Paenalcaligenes sp. Me131 TaxID=3392636 RepID=UPI003D2A27DE
MRIDGLILAGGQSRRMQALGAVDKGLLTLEGLSFAEHATKRLGPYCQQLFISANAHQADYAAWGEVVGDGEYEAQGPLAGMLAVMRRSQADYIVTLPVDSPFVSDQVIRTMVQQASLSPEVAIHYAYAVQAHPLCALLRTDLVESLHDYLAQGERRVQSWYASVNAKTVHFGDAAEAEFLNVNTPEDWQHAQSLRG